jgi:hypothetical protein
VKEDENIEMKRIKDGKYEKSAKKEPKLECGIKRESTMNLDAEHLV